MRRSETSFPLAPSPGRRYHHLVPLIVGADKRVSDAFLTQLRDEPPPPSSTMTLAAFARKEKSVVKVDGLGAAITAAEEVIRERVRSGSRPDIFESLSIPTDDASGPALYHPYVPTPIPPRPVSTLPPPPVLALPPIVFHPTQPVFQPEPLPAPETRRSVLGWFAVAFVTPLALVAAVIGSVSFYDHHRPMSGRAVLVSNAPTPIVAPAPVVAKPASSVLVVDAKALKSVTLPRKTRR